MQPEWSYDGKTSLKRRKLEDEDEEESSRLTKRRSRANSTVIDGGQLTQAELRNPLWDEALSPGIGIMSSDDGSFPSAVRLRTFREEVDGQGVAEEDDIS